MALSRGTRPFMLPFVSWSLRTTSYTRFLAITLQRIWEITPDDIAVASSIAFVDLDWRADTAPLHQFIDRLRSERLSEVGDTADIGFLCALAERDWAAAEQALIALGNNPFWGDLVTLRRQFG